MGGNHVTGFSNCNAAEGCGSDGAAGVVARSAIGQNSTHDTISCQSMLTLFGGLEWIPHVDVRHIIVLKNSSR